eukprot:Gb_19186 [translate_table: standard]
MCKSATKVTPHPRLAICRILNGYLRAGKRNGCLVTSTRLLKRRKKEERVIRHKDKKQKCNLECIKKKMHVEEASTCVEPGSNQVSPIEARLQREKSNVQMGKKKRLLKRSLDSQETKGEMKSQNPRRPWVTHSPI